jgi:uridine kinase
MIYCKLPSTIQNKVVLLMDPMIGTGATALMAIRVLLDHDVKEENIFFLTLISTLTGQLFEYN